MIDEDGNTHFADLWTDEKARERYLPITATLILAAGFGLLAAYSFLVSAVGIVQTLKS